MKLCKRIFSLRSVLIVLLFAAVLIVPASAVTAPIFSIPGNTSVVFPTDEMRTMSTTDYGPLNIPEGLSVSISKNDADGSLSSSDDARYTLVTFADPISTRSNIVTLPISLHGTSRTLILEKININLGDDGIDSYYGSIQEVENSTVILTVADGNFLHVSIRLPNEIISVYPVQNRQYASQTLNPVHIVYSSNDLVYGEENTTGICGTESVGQSISSRFSSQSFDERSKSNVVSITVHVVTDTQFYLDSSNWRVDAAQYMANVWEQFQRDDIGVRITYTLDDSKRNELNSHHLHLTDPLETLRTYYPPLSLHDLNADICVYLGGHALTGERSTYVGNNAERYCWVRMPGQSWTMFYDGSAYARSSCLIHEIGHSFNADHNYSYEWFAPTLSGKQFTVMSASYQGETRGQLNEFSSVSYHGTSYYDNARHIRASKQTVSTYSQRTS